MEWIREKLFGKRPRQVVQGGVCDSCNTDLRSVGTYYYLTTRDVVLSERYWEHAFKANLAVWTMFAADETQLQGMFQQFVTSMAGQSSPWSICENCSEFFFFDREPARSHATGRTAPDGIGAVDPSGCLLFAALGWERAAGRWPASVHQPPALDSCDFCDKTVYEGEIDFFVPKATYDRDRAEGLMWDEPLRAARARDGEVGWQHCFPCMSRHAALVYRRRPSA